MANPRKTNKCTVPPLGKPVNFSNPITRDLLAYWLLNEGGGQIAIDSARKRLNGTLANSSSFNTTSRGIATTTVSMGAPTTLQFNNTQPFTFSCWVNYTSLASGNTLFAYGLSAGRGYYIEMGAVGTGLYNFDYYDGTNFARASSTDAIVTGSWYHIAVTRNRLNTVGANGSNSIYINGIDKSSRGGSVSAPGSINYTSTLFNIGARGTATNNTLKGVVQNFAIWTRALTHTEIKKLYSEPYCLTK